MDHFEKKKICISIGGDGIMSPLKLFCESRGVYEPQGIKLLLR